MSLGSLVRFGWIYWGQLVGDTKSGAVLQTIRRNRKPLQTALFFILSVDKQLRGVLRRFSAVSSSINAL